MPSTWIWFTLILEPYMNCYPVLRDHHLIPQHETHQLFLPLMELLVKYPKPLLKLLPNRSRSRMLLLIVHLRIHLALVKHQRSTLFSLPQRTNPWKLRRKEKARVKSMPQNKVLLNHLLAMLHNEILSIHASFVRSITILRIVPDGLKLVILSKGSLLSSKRRFLRISSVHDEYSYQCSY